jgi:hypothetical protein
MQTGMKVALQEKEVFARLKAWVEEQRRPFTLNDAAAGTGIAMQDLVHAFDKLIETYHCRVQATAQGDVIYDFGGSLRRRHAKTVTEILLEILDILWKGFQVLYKVCIALMMMIYFGVYVTILLIALIMLSLASKDGRSGRREFFSNLGEIVKVWGYLFDLATETEEGKKGFLASVYDFVFGPPREQPDKLNNEKELAAFLRKKKGITVGAELQALAGWSTDQMEEFLAMYAAKFHGRLKVSEDGVLYAEFDELLRGKVKTNETPIVYYWDEDEPKYLWTGNKVLRNLGIVSMNAFNLLMSFLVLKLDGTLFDLTPTVRILLGWVPFIYSVLFFAIPLGRGVWILKKQYEQHQAHIRRRVMKAVFEKKAAPKTLEQIERLVNADPNMESLSRRTIQKMMDKLLIELRGKLEADTSSGKVYYVFDRIHNELEAIQTLRKQRQVSQDLSDVILDSNASSHESSTRPGASDSRP